MINSENTLTENDYRNALFNAHLKSFTDAKNIKDIAYAQLISIALFLQEDISEDEIRKIISNQILQIKNIPKESISSALELLKLYNIIEKKSGKWNLTNEAKEDFEKQSNNAQAEEKKILQKFFPKSIGYTKLQNWFLDTSAKYFSFEDDRLISDFLQNKQDQLNIDEILRGTIKKYNLEKFSDELSLGYKEFLADDDSAYKIWDFMQGLLSTKLVVADISPNLISIERYKNSKIIIDTNVLFAVSLKDKKIINKSLLTLSQAMQSIGAQLYITEWTKEEYLNVCWQEERSTIKIFDGYDEEIIRNTRGGFIKAAYQAKCKNGNDVEKLFEEIKKTPTQFGEIKIETIKKEESDEIIFDNHNQQDIRLYNEIYFAWKNKDSKRPPKGRYAIKHDLLLTKFVRKKQENERFFILTLDRSMEALSLSWINEKENPVWVNFLTLIQILAINGAGADFDSRNLAPLIKSFIEYQGCGRFQKYKKQDLLLLANCTDRINEIPITKVQSVLNKIHKKNMSGLSKKDKKDLELEIQRDLTKSKEDVKQSMIERDVKINTLEEENKNKENENFRLRKEKFRNKQMFWLIIRIFASFACSLLLFFILRKELFEQFNLSKWEFISMIFFIFAPFGLAYKSLQKYKKEMKNFKN